MARKERNDVDYFPHSVNHGKEMFYIRSKFKNDGYAVWYMLQEQLGKSEYHYIDLSDNTNLMYLSAEFGVEENTVLEIINVLVGFGEFDKELWELDKILFSQRFVENIADAYKKRHNSCIDRNQLLILLTSKGRSLSSKSIPYEGLGILKVSDNTQRKEKESKEEYKKEKKEKSFYSSKLTPNPSDSSKSKKSPLSESEINLIRSTMKCKLHDFDGGWEEYHNAMTEDEEYCSHLGHTFTLRTRAFLWEKSSDELRDYSNKLWSMTCDGYARVVQTIAQEKFEWEKLEEERLENEENLRQEKYSTPS